MSAWLARICAMACPSSVATPIDPGLLAHQAQQMSLDQLRVFAADGFHGGLLNAL